MPGAACKTVTGWGVAGRILSGRPSWVHPIRRLVAGVVRGMCASAPLLVQVRSCCCARVWLVRRGSRVWSWPLAPTLLLCPVNPLLLACMLVPSCRAFLVLPPCFVVPTCVNATWVLAPLVGVSRVYLVSRCALWMRVKILPCCLTYEFGLGPPRVLKKKMKGSHNLGWCEPPRSVQAARVLGYF